MAKKNHVGGAHFQGDIPQLYWRAAEVTQTLKAYMQNLECDEFEANENNLWKTVQQPAKKAISHNMSCAKQRCYEDTICFKGSVQLELTVLVFHLVSFSGHPPPPRPPLRKLLAASSPPWTQSQLYYWVSHRNGLRRAIEIRRCTYTKVGQDRR